MVCPTSVVQNWISQSEEHTPGLRVLNYTGSSRTTDPDQIATYDVVVTTYGIVSSEWNEETKPKDKGGKKRKAASAHKEALRVIRLEQTHANMPVWPYASFKRLVLEVAQDFKTDLAVEPLYVKLVLDRLEAYLIGLLGDAHLQAIHRGSTKVEPKDLQMARRMRGERA